MAGITEEGEVLGSVTLAGKETAVVWNEAGNAETLTLPGVGAGCLLTFIISAGYYVTPTLVGGASDQMLSYFVAFYANTTINWGMSAALGVLLLTCILALYAAVGRIVGIGRIVGME